MIILFFLTLLFCPPKPTQPPAAHHYYASLSTIVWNEKSNTIECSVQVFSDDFEHTLTKTGCQQPALVPNTIHVDTENCIEDYLANHFKIWINDTVLSLNYIGSEIGFDNTICYLESGALNEAPQKLKIRIDLLCAIFPEQQNRVNIEIKGKKSSALLHKKHTEEQLNFNF